MTNPEGYKKQHVTIRGIDKNIFVTNFAIKYPNSKLVGKSCSKRKLTAKHKSLIARKKKCYTFESTSTIQFKNQVIGCVDVCLSLHVRMLEKRTVWTSLPVKFYLGAI